MRLAASNIAWAPEDRLAVYDRMAVLGYRGLEIAPALFLWDSVDPLHPGEAEIARAVGELSSRGLELVSMQALLFGAGEVALFETPDRRAAFVAAMVRAIDLGGQLGIPNLVFGSPKQRCVPEGMRGDEVAAIATDVFGSLADRAVTAGTRVSLEANPAAYGTNFWTSLPEVFAFLAGMRHPGLTATLDLGTLRLTGAMDGLAALVRNNLGWIGHAHASTPMLAPLASPGGATPDETCLDGFLAALADAGYREAVSLEMRGDAGPEALVASLAMLAAGGAK